jgi:hypothetical protein
MVRLEGGEGNGKGPEGSPLVGFQEAQNEKQQSFFGVS